MLVQSKRINANINAVLHILTRRKRNNNVNVIGMSLGAFFYWIWCLPMFGKKSDMVQVLL